MEVRIENWAGHDIRFVEADRGKGLEWCAIAMDVAKALEYSETGKMTRRLDKETILKVDIQALDDPKGRARKTQTYNVLTKRGLYSAIGGSRKVGGAQLRSHLNSVGIYANMPKQTKFETMLQKALSHIGISYETEKVVDNYRLDFYIPELNIIIEYDEVHHRSQLEEDKFRESTLSKFIPNSKILRVSEGKEVEGLADIIMVITVDKLKGVC